MIISNSTNWWYFTKYCIRWRWYEYRHELDMGGYYWPLV